MNRKNGNNYDLLNSSNQLISIKQYWSDIYIYFICDIFNYLFIYLLIRSNFKNNKVR